MVGGTVEGSGSSRGGGGEREEKKKGKVTRTRTRTRGRGGRGRPSRGGEGRRGRAPAAPVSCNFGLVPMRVAACGDRCPASAGSGARLDPAVAGAAARRSRAPSSLARFAFAKHAPAQVGRAPRRNRGPRPPPSRFGLARATPSPVTVGWAFGARSSGRLAGFAFFVHEVPARRQRPSGSLRLVRMGPTVNPDGWPATGRRRPELREFHGERGMAHMTLSGDFVSFFIRASNTWFGAAYSTRYVHGFCLLVR